MLVWTNDAFTLRSGIKSHVYFHGRNDVTDNPELLDKCGALIGATLSTLCRDDGRQPILIGVPTAANGFAASITHYRPTGSAPRPGFRVMREKVKEHGSSDQKNRWVNGKPDTTAHYYATIENVVTSGASLSEAIERIESDGYKVRDMPHLVFMDRQQGGVAKLRNSGLQIITLFELLDVVWAFKELGLQGWDANRVLAVETEIKAHQIP